MMSSHSNYSAQVCNCNCFCSQVATSRSVVL